MTITAGDLHIWSLIPVVFASIGFAIPIMWNIGSISRAIGKVFMYVFEIIHNFFYKGFCCAGMCQNKRHVPDDAPMSMQCGSFCGDCVCIPCRALHRHISGRTDEQDIESQSRHEQLVPPGSQVYATNEQQVYPDVADSFPQPVQPGLVASDSSVKVVRLEDGNLYHLSLNEFGKPIYDIIH